MADTKVQFLVDYRYILLEKLGQGGMGIVFRAYDRLKGEIVALKCMQLSTGSSVGDENTTVNFHVELIREFAALAKLRHPNIISVRDYGIDALGTPYFTMELLENASDIYQTSLKNSTQEKIEYVIQALRALVYLHQHEMIHRDLKPANMLVQHEQVKLLDFGLALLKSSKEKTYDTDKTEKDTISGTFSYMALEAFLGKSDHRSDLYSIGVIIYELLTGQNPFQGKTAQEILRILFDNGPDLELLREITNPEIVAVVKRLLDKEPDNRYEDAAQVIEALGYPILTEGTVRAVSGAAPFAGREKELSVLKEKLNAAILEDGGIVFIRGESGVGKSRLLDELRIYALAKQAIVLRGQGVKGGGKPYQLWRDIVRWLALSTEITEMEGRILMDIVPDIDKILLWNTITPAPKLSSEAGQKRLIQTVVDVLRRQERPLVLILEDLQWADESLEIIRALAPAIKNLPLLVVGSYRDKKAVYEPINIPETETHTLEPMTDDEIGQIVKSILGEKAATSAIITSIQHMTSGNSFFIVETTRIVMEKLGDISILGSGSSRRRAIASTLREITQHHLRRIPASDQEILRIAALIGRQIDRALMADLSPDINLDAWLIKCGNAKILEVEADEWRFTHDKLQNGILENMLQADLENAHRQIAESIERVYPGGKDHLVALAYHWETAKEMALAGEWYFRAGKEAETAYALGSAITYYQKALELLPSDLHISRMEAQSGLGKLLRWRGAFDKAEQAYKSILEVAGKFGDETAQVRALIGLSDVEGSRGKYQLSIEYAQRAVDLARAIGKDAEQELAEALGNLAWGNHQIGQNQNALNFGAEALKISESIDLKREVARGHSVLGVANFMLGHDEQATQHTTQARDIYRALGDKSGTSIEFNNLGEYLRLRGRYNESILLFEEARRIFQEIAYLNNEWATIVNIAACNLALGQYPQAEGVLMDIVEPLQRENWWGVPEVGYLLSESCRLQGKLDEALKWAEIAYHAAQPSGVGEFIGKAWRVLGLAAAAKGTTLILDAKTYTPADCFDQSLVAFAQPDNPERAYSLQAYEEFLRQRGRTQEAIEMEKEAQGILKNLGMVKP